MDRLIIRVHRKTASAQFYEARVLRMTAKKTDILNIKVTSKKEKRKCPIFVLPPVGAVKNLRKRKTQAAVLRAESFSAKPAQSRIMIFAVVVFRRSTDFAEKRGRQSPVTALAPRHPLYKEGFRSSAASF